MLPAFIKYKVNFYFIRLVEHIGFEPMTSSMPWKRASQLRQCPVAPSCFITKTIYILSRRDYFFGFVVRGNM